MVRVVQFMVNFIPECAKVKKVIEEDKNYISDLC